jgi:hypothetical protein
MYENAFGKQLASSIELAFKAARWDTMLNAGSGFESGVKVGPGPVGARLRDAVAQVTGFTDVTAVRANEPDLGFYFIGVGAKTE